MKGKKITILGLIILSCLLITGALSNQFIGHTHAWFTSIRGVDAVISADSSSPDWIVDYNLNGDLGLVETGGTADKIIGTITARIDNLTVSYEILPPPDLDPSQGIYDIQSLRYTDLITPTSPFTITNAGDSVTLIIQVKVLGKHDLGLYKGQLVISFADPSIEPLIVPLQVEVVKKI